MKFEEKYFELLNLDSKYANLTISGELVWPYVRNKIYGQIHREYNFLDNGGLITNLNPSTFLAAEQLTNFTEKVDAIIFHFNRMVMKSGTIYDEKTEDLYLQLKKQNKKVIRVVHNEEGVNRLYDDNTYRTDDVRIVFDKRNFTYQISDKEYGRLYELQVDVQSKISEKFIVAEIINEVANRAVGYHNYYRAIYNRLRPKVIFITSNYMRQEMLIPAKEMGIPVYDIQYAAFTNCHSGYHLSDNYPFFPDGILGWSMFWQRKEIFGKQKYDYKVLGYSEHECNKEVDVKQKIEKNIVFVSQNLISHFIEKEAIKFAENYPDYSVILKLHPNDSEQTSGATKKYPNLTIVKDCNLSMLLERAKYVVGVGSTVIYDAIQKKCKILILDNYMNAYMKNLTEKENVYFVEHLVNDFEEIRKKQFNEEIGEIYTEIRNIPFSEYRRKDDSNYDVETNNILEYIENDIYVREAKIKNNRTFYEYKQLFRKPLLSVVIPCHNSEKTLPMLLAMLSKLKCFPYVEIILINDGSTDKTEEVLKSFKKNKKNIKLITNRKPSGGASVPRNQGLSFAEGKYVYFLDSDDYLYQNNLDIILLQALEKNVDMVKCSVLVNSSGTGKKWGIIKREYTREQFFESSDHFNITFLHNHLYKLAVLEQNNLNLELLTIGEDLDFNLKVYQYMESIYCSDLSINVYQKGLSSLSKRMNSEIFSEILRNFYKNYLSIRDNHLYSEKQTHDFINNLIVKNILKNPDIIDNLGIILDSENEVFLYNLIQNIEFVTDIKLDKSLSLREGLINLFRKYDVREVIKIVNIQFNKGIIYFVLEKMGEKLFYEVNLNEKDIFEIDFNDLVLENIQKRFGQYKTNYWFKSENNKITCYRSRLSSPFFNVRIIKDFHSNFIAVIDFLASEEEIKRDEYYVGGERLGRTAAIAINGSFKIVSKSGRKQDFHLLTSNWNSHFIKVNENELEPKMKLTITKIKKEEDGIYIFLIADSEEMGLDNWIVSVNNNRMCFTPSTGSSTSKMTRGETKIKIAPLDSFNEFKYEFKNTRLDIAKKIQFREQDKIITIEPITNGFLIIKSEATARKKGQGIWRKFI